MSPFTKSWLAPVVIGVLLGVGATPWAAQLSATPLPGIRVPTPEVAALNTAAVSAEPLVPEMAGQACPNDMVLVEGRFCPKLRYVCHTGVDETQRCASEYQKGVPCHGTEDFRRYCIDRYEWPNRKGESPDVWVSWHEAKDKCAERGKRLCRRSEWVMACEGPKRVPFPWGFQRYPSPCNIDRKPIPFDLDKLQDEATRQQEIERLYQAYPSGARPECKSDYGVFDMTGNVDEWTDNTTDNPDTRYPSSLNGGWWGPVRNTCRLTTKAHGPSFHFYQIGFRCCKDTGDDVDVPPPRLWVDEAGGFKRAN